MVKNIIQFPDASLLLVAQPFPIEYKTDLTNLITDLQNTAAHHRAAGLSAPQIGVPSRVLVFRNKDDYYPLINPIIVSQSEDKRKFKEGCLSIPEVFTDIIRPRDIVVEGINEHFDAVSLSLNQEDNLSLIVQHEIDHLNGILILDRISKYDRSKLVTEYFKASRKRNKRRY
jgi:peptide deformylase